MDARRLRISGSCAALLLAALLLAGHPFAGRRAAAPGWSTQSPKAETGIALTDQSGRTMFLPGPARRVGTPGISMASLLLAIGGRGSLAAATPEVASNPWLTRIFPELSGLPTPFSRPTGFNLEALLARRPDMALLWRGTARQRAVLESAGVPVLTVAYATPAELRRAARLLGRALGPEAEARAAAFVRFYDAALARVAAGLAGLPAPARPRVYYASIDPLRTEGAGTMVDSWISLAGGVNVAAAAGLRGDARMHMEDVLALDPQVVFAIGRSQRAAILADPRWRGVAAVRAGRVYVCPKGVNVWSARAAETALQVLWAAKTLHPDRFRALDIEEETRRFHKIFYGYDLSPDELSRMLRGDPPPEGRRT